MPSSDIGKFRCYGDVTPFRGCIELQQVQRLPAEVPVQDNNGASAAPTYCATGGFALQATSQHGLSGQFNGRIALDFQIARSQRAVLMENTTNPTTRRGGLLFDGNWRNGPDGGPVPAVWKHGLVVSSRASK